MNTICPICQSTDVLNKAEYRSRSKVFSDMHIYRCEQCMMHFAYPMPDNTLLDEYNNNYFDSAHGGKASNSVESAFFSSDSIA